MLRYYLYSIEGGYTPHEPYYEDNDLDTCIAVCKAFSESKDVNCYVVDRTVQVLFAEVYVHTGSNFTKLYEETCEQIRKLKL